MPKNLLRRFVLLALTLSFAPLALAQIAGSLRGTVADKTGAVLPGVTVSLTNEATKFSRQAVTDAKGGFFFASLDPGTYSLKAELSGFKGYESKENRVSASATSNVDVALEVGAQTDKIEVTASREMISTSTGAREGLITGDQIENISIIGRNPLELLRTLPGVVAPAQGNFEQNGISAGFGGADQAFSVNGTRPANLGITLDGANLRDVGNNSGMMNVPNNEFVAEVKVQMSNYMAEFGTAALNVQAITKSGSSEFHGTIYDYLRANQFAANDRARNFAALPRPETKFQYPGFNLSGPIVIPGTGFNKNRDKAFFFLGYEWNFQTLAPDPLKGVVPTAGMRQGLFNDYGAGQHLNLPTSINIPKGFAGAGTPAPNGDLRPYQDSIGTTLLNLYPQPNYNDPDNRYNYIFNALTKADRNQGVLRVDYNINDNVKAYVRLARDSETNTNARGLWWQPGSIELPSPVEGTAIGRSAVANVTAVLSPTTTNEVLFTYSQLRNDNRFQDPAKMQLATYGASALQNPFGGSGYIPDLVLNFNSSQSMWFAQDVDNIFSYNGFMRFGDNLTKVANTHAIKIGGIVERQYKQQNFQHQNNMQLNFANWGNGSTGNDFADVLVGRPAQAVVGQPSAVGNFVAWNFEGYIQDSWRARKNLTLEYGVRIGKWTNNNETNDLGAIFDPALYNRNAGTFLDAARTQVNGLASVKNGQVDAGLTDARPLLIMPRANFAWDISGNGEMILRGGGGIFYNREQGNAQYNVINLPPNSYATTLDAGSLQNINNGQGLNYRTIGGVDPFGQLNGFDLSTMSLSQLDWPRMYQVSTSLSRRIPGHQTLEVGYVGTFGRHLAAQFQINSVPAGQFLSGTINGSNLAIPINRAALDNSVVNGARPYPTLQNVNIFQPIGRSNYHGFQTTLSRQTGSFTYLLAYTYSKLQGTVGNDFAQIDPLDPSRSYGILLADRPHNATLSWTLRLGEPVKTAVGRTVLGGWNLSGVSTFISGQPIRLGFTGDLGSDQAELAWYGTKDYLGYSRDFSQGSIGAITPTFTCNPSTGGSKMGEKILDISCIGIPGFQESGPAVSPFRLRGPSQSFHDLTIFKDFHFGKGSKRLQFRTGVFNLFNQAYPTSTANPGPDVDYTLETSCNVRRSGIPNGNGGTSDNVCDPTGGYSFTANTLANFGKITNKRGHRVIEFALRLFF
jgi:Carboxypeptidase regulatory-like domain/TonB-dependent Receptor Plug Domain